MRMTQSSIRKSVDFSVQREGGGGVKTLSVYKIYGAVYLRISIACSKNVAIRNFRVLLLN